MFFLSYSHTAWASVSVRKVLYKGWQIKTHILKIMLFFSAPAWGWEQFHLLCLLGSPYTHPSPSERVCWSFVCTDGIWPGLAHGNPAGNPLGWHAPFLPSYLHTVTEQLISSYRCCHRAATACQAREDHLGELCRCVPVIWLETCRDPKAMFFVQAWSIRCVGGICIWTCFLSFLTHFVILNLNWLWHWFLPGGSSALYQQEVCLSPGCSSPARFPSQEDCTH